MINSRANARSYLPLVVMSVAIALPSGVDAFPRIPKIPKIKKVKLPKPPRESSTPPETKGQREANRGLEGEFYRMKDVLLKDISFSWTSPADNAPVDAAAQEYYKTVDTFAGGRFDGLRGNQLADFKRVLSAHYDNRTKDRWLDRQITFAESNRGNGAGDRTYNDLLVLETMLYGAINIFPDNQQYLKAKAKVDAVMAKYGGSRAGATQKKDAELLAKAKSVRMPPAIQRSKAIEDMFRRAWATGGIPYTIRKIHIRSGWGVKRNAYGRVLGKTRDAAIATKDPKTGHCYLFDFTMIVEAGGSPRRSSHAAKRMACENIPK